jgi:multiple sugar transport system ATP-binding protein
VREPQLFLFDEPLSNLDAELRVQMRVELSKLHAKLGTTMIYVTHDQIEAMTMADRIVVLRDGVIEQTGSPLELYNRPANQFVAGFIGSPKMNFLNAKLVSQSQSATLLELSGGRQLSVKAIGRTLEAGTPVVVGIRPEHMLLGEGALEAKVDIIEQLGGNTVIYASLPDGQSLVAQVVGQSLITRDATVNLSWPTEQCHVFDSQGLTLTNS